MGLADRQRQVADNVAEEAFAVLDTGRQVIPFSARHAGFDISVAYHVTAAVRAQREARGERPVGRKIGFTNRTIWAEYEVFAPMWGYVYDTTVHDLSTLKGTFDASRLAEPRIEPEIVFGLAERPQPGMSDADLFGCIGWIAHGFEIVQSIFPAWSFEAADTVAGYGLHGALLVGPRVQLPAERRAWEDDLATFEIDLCRNGAPVDHGRAANVLDGPLLALKHLVGLLDGETPNPPLEAGEIVTTGTLTRAFPISPGETWTTTLTGVGLKGLSVEFQTAGR